MYAKPETGLLYFILFKSTHVVNAYKKGKEIVVGFVLHSNVINNSTKYWTI